MEKITRLFDILTEQSNTVTVSTKIIAVSFILAFILSVLLVIVYQITTSPTKQNRHFLQSLILLSLVSAMIMMAIGDNIARGLGILGALSIIRFRTNIRNPRNITFTFASLAAGLACGIHGFTVAILGTVFFGVVALFLRFSWFGGVRELEGLFRLEVIHNDTVKEDIQGTLAKYCRVIELVEVKHLFRATKDLVEPSRFDDGRLRKSYVFRVLLNASIDSAEISQYLGQIPDIEKINFEQRTVEDDV